METNKEFRQRTPTSVTLFSEGLSSKPIRLAEGKAKSAGAFAKSLDGKAKSTGGFGKFFAGNVKSAGGFVVTRTTPGYGRFRRIDPAENQSPFVVQRPRTVAFFVAIIKAKWRPQLGYRWSSD